MIFLIVLAAFGEGGPLAVYVPDVIQWVLSDDSAFVWIIVGGTLAVVVLYFISMIAALKLYETREF